VRKIETHKATRVRFTILAGIFISVVINYMDRSNISVAAPMITKEFNLSTIQLGYIFSAFGWTYALLQIPGGILTDRFGPRIIYTCSLVLWSIVTVAQGFAKGFLSLFGLRMAIGVFEAPSYPTNNRIVTSWFPDNERASAIGIYTSGQFIGLAFLAPVLTGLEQYAGWKGLFIITGIVGIIWGITWYFFYRDPAEHPRANEAELNFIEDGGGLINREFALKKNKPPQFKWNDLKEVFIHKKLWGIYLGQFAVGSTLWFFLTWFPTYLVKYRHIDFIQSGFLSSLPFLSAFVGILLAGFSSDYMIKKGVSANVARKAPIVIGLLLSMSIIGANYVSSPALIILFMCIAFFGNGFASITWVFVSILAPKHLVGLTGGVFNFIGGLAGIIVPATIGYIVTDSNFTPAIILIAIIGALGALSYIFLVGKVERVGIGKKSG
jgi:ACS family D-galactonate transporter-like MFS transporter